MNSIAIGANECRDENSIAPPVPGPLFPADEADIRIYNDGFLLRSIQGTGGTERQERADGIIRGAAQMAP
jgi:hypothetical protein